MQNQDIHKHYTDLTAKYLSGNASPAEVAELEAWVLTEASNKEQFQAIKKAWMLSGVNQVSRQVDVTKNWEQTAGELFKETKVVDLKSRQKRRPWMAIAAGFALLILAGTFIYLNMGSDPGLIVETETEAEFFDLSDGSHISLNQESSLTYGFDKERSQRRVALIGDAFFEVTRNESQPFIVTTGGLEIEVLGTAFYVDSREDQEEIQVIVESGRVAVRSSDTEVILTANEKAIFQVNTSILKKEVNEDSNYTALKTNVLVFEEDYLQEVIFALNRQYNARIRIESEVLNQCTLTATYPNLSLDEILLLLESGFGIQVDRNGSEIMLSGTCKK